MWHCGTFLQRFALRLTEDSWAHSVVREQITKTGNPTVCSRSNGLEMANTSQYYYANHSKLWTPQDPGLNFENCCVSVYWPRINACKT